MSSNSDTCNFGHLYELDDRGQGGLSSDAEEAISKFKSEEITSFEEFKRQYIDNPDKDVNQISDVMGGSVRKVTVSGGGQGAGYEAIHSAADDYDGLGYDTTRIEESIFVSPQSQLHDEFMQRKQQAEQRVNQTLSSYSDILEQKHMLEHDIRKLRGRAEAFDLDEGDETILKGDFVELVDGANAGAQQGGEAAIKTLVERNIYPTIMSDFMEMDSVDDLKKAENHEDIEEDGKLADLPNNEKAVLRKKYAMYEKWKDLYGSEVNRRLKELKSQLQNIERSIENTKNWLEPYVRDVVMINEIGDSQSKLTEYGQWKGYASMMRDLQFMCYKGLKKKNGELQDAGGSDATHYRVMHITGVHIVGASAEQPNQPGDSSVGIVMWRPVVMCDHIFENIFKPRVKQAEAIVDEMMGEYVGEFKPGEGTKYKEKRKEKNLSVRELRKKVGEELDRKVPVEFSSRIRRIEDGLDEPRQLQENYEEEYEALNKILEIEKGDENGGPNTYTALQRKLKVFTGKTGKYYISGDPIGDMMSEFNKSFYKGYKKGLGLNAL